jgi:hypothetical protein
MMEFGAILELMYAAPARIRSLHATLLERFHPRLLEGAFTSFIGQSAAGGVGGRFERLLPRDSDPRTSEQVVNVELWWQGDCWREERWGKELECVRVADASEFRVWTPILGLRIDKRPIVHPHGGLELLSPSVFLDGYALDLSSPSPAQVAERPVTTVLARSTAARVGARGLLPGLDEAELILDKEFGVVLRRAERWQGRDAFVREVTTIAYDVPIASDRFQLKSPERWGKP